MQGRIVKIITRRYIVESGGKFYNASSRGKLRNKNIKPIVGDIVDLDIDPEDENFAYICKVHKRNNFLKRPETANVSMVIVTFAVRSPNPDFKLLNSLLVACEIRGITPLICFNKSDIDKDRKFINDIIKIYSNLPYKIVFTGFENRDTIKDLVENLSLGVNVIAGPSGVGKSTIINKIIPNANMETSGISKKLMRGKHTTRHSELFRVKEGVFLCDTPGFTNYTLDDIDILDFKNYMPDINEFSYDCKFSDCIHIFEPKCSVLNAVKENKISVERYEFYKSSIIYIKEKSKY
ncbi:MAG: ribosome small subunit-dependent GTPase A [Clostridiales bacterium]|nr:MAG: ribosome small subunit-dependent GTPase A [Clostridiales bacterium]